MNRLHRKAALCAVLVLALALSAPAVALAGVTPVMPGDLIGSTGAVGGSLLDIDPGTGAGNVRFASGSLGPVTDIDFAPNGTLYGTTGGGSANLIIIDPDTGSETLVAQHSPGAIPGIEFVGDTLYGAYFGGGPGLGAGDELVIIDPTDATLTPVGTLTGYSPVRGLAYDPVTDTLYGVGSPIGVGGVGQARENLGIPGDELFTIDRATGATTPIGPTGYEIIGGLEFGPNGILYGGIAFAGTPPPPPALGNGADGDLVSIDTTTGAATVIGSTGASAISGLSFYPAAVIGPSVLEIPTLSQLGALLLAGLLAFAGLLALRHR